MCRSHKIKPIVLFFPFHLEHITVYHFLIPEKYIYNSCTFLAMRSHLYSSQISSRRSWRTHHFTNSKPSFHPTGRYIIARLLRRKKEVIGDLSWFVSNMARFSSVDIGKNGREGKDWVQRFRWAMRWCWGRNIVRITESRVRRGGLGTKGHRRPAGHYLTSLCLDLLVYKTRTVVSVSQEFGD